MTHGPLVILHDHLDGGVRPATVLELAHRLGISTPADTVEGLADWFTVTPEMSTAEAFSRFDVVGSVLQSEAALARVAREAVEDLAADGVIHAELRFAPLLHTLGDLSPAAVIAAVESGLDAGQNDTGLDARLIVCAMRDQPDATSLVAVEAAAAAGGRVVGVDLAGAEIGHLASVHAAAFARAHEAGLGVTIHAGEMDGHHQIQNALDTCHPHRIGHGWRVIDDCEVSDGRITGLGPTAAALRDGGVPLEICLTSNATLGMPVAEHPFRMLSDAGFRISLNPDDRVITTTSPLRELDLARELHGVTRVEFAAWAERAAEASFLADGERAALAQQIRDGWDVAPARLVHLAESDRWEAARAGGAYLPDAFERDGFIHLSGLHQLLTPANAFYRGRNDLVALVVDAHLIAKSLVWESDSGCAEFFPHLYGALGTDAVLHEIDFAPLADGGFLLPLDLVGAVRG